ncbi:MAG: flippase family protein [Fibrobacteria bacterium]|jgi:O-antigen/teichoic acid export membrane protein|nr:flippase family protein [Fibrobacteria bacterium]
MREQAGLGREAGLAVRWNAAAAAVTLASQLLQILFLARWLSPAEFGLAAVAVSAAGFLHGFCDLGLANALVQREAVPKEGWSSALWATLVTGIVLGLALAAFSAPLEAALRLQGLAPLLAAAAFALPGFGPASVLQAHLQRHLRFRRLAAAEILAAVVSLAVALAWAQRHRDAGALVAGLIALGAARLVALGAFSTLELSWRLNLRDLSSLSSFGGYQMGTRALDFAVGNLDRLLVARLLGVTATGFYTMASQIALRPTALIGPFVGRTLLPLLARLQGERTRMAAAYLRSLSVLGFLSALVYGLLFGLAEPLVKLALGPGWEPAIPTLRILSLLGFLTVLGNAIGNLTLAMGRAGFVFWMNAAVLTARLGGVVLGARYGLTGVAAAMSLLMALSLPIDLILPRRWLGIPVRETAWAGGWAALPAALTAGGLAALSAAVSLAPWLEVLLLGVSGTLFFGAAAWTLHRRRLRETLREIAGKLR